jgi:hypothetical protein
MFEEEDHTFEIVVDKNETVFPEDIVVPPSAGALAARSELTGFTAGKMYNINNRVFTYVYSDTEVVNDSSDPEEGNGPNVARLIAQLGPMIATNETPQGLARVTKKPKRLQNHVL